MTETPNLTSQAVFQAAAELFPGGVNSPVRAFKSVGGEPFVVERGEGAYLYDVDGNRYIDYINSWGPLVLGHSHPAVVSALGAQLERGTSYGACCEQEVKLGKLITSLMPSIEMLRFVNSGTEAGMSVLRLARGYTGRSKIIKFAGCYHGHADALLVKAGSGSTTLGIPNSAGVAARCVEDTLLAEFNDVDSVKSLFEGNPEGVAAVILEPAMGNSGLVEPEQGFLHELRRLCDSYGALLIFDEVMTGFRVALEGAQGLYGVTPDLTMLGKVIGGGLPVGAFGGRREIMEQLAPLGPVYQAGTLSGNPLAMTAGLATLIEWTQPGNFEIAAEGAQRIANGLAACANESGIPLQTDSLGTMFGFFFSESSISNYTEACGTDIELFSQFFQAALRQGIYFAPSAFEAGFVSTAHCPKAIDETLERLPEVFREIG